LAAAQASIVPERFLALTKRWLAKRDDERAERTGAPSSLACSLPSPRFRGKEGNCENEKSGYEAERERNVLAGCVL